MDSNIRGLVINPAFKVYVQGPPGRMRQNREDEIMRCVLWATQTSKNSASLRCVAIIHIVSFAADDTGAHVAKPFGAGVQPDKKPDHVLMDVKFCG